MNKDEIYAYWNYSRIFRTIPEKDYEKPNVQQFLNTYAYLEDRFLNYMDEVNKNLGKSLDNGKKNGIIKEEKENKE